MHVCVCVPSAKNIHIQWVLGKEEGKEKVYMNRDGLLNLYSNGCSNLNSVSLKMEGVRRMKSTSQVFNIISLARKKGGNKIMNI